MKRTGITSAIIILISVLSLISCSFPETEVIRDSYDTVRLSSDRHGYLSINTRDRVISQSEASTGWKYRNSCLVMNNEGRQCLIDLTANNNRYYHTEKGDETSFAMLIDMIRASEKITLSIGNKDYPYTLDPEDKKMIEIALSQDKQMIEDGDYRRGDWGPAGGIIVYDCDFDNHFGNADGLVSSECGWRYIEAAPGNLQLDSDGSVKLATKGRKYTPGYYRLSANGFNQKIEEQSEALGAGAMNTELIIAQRGATAFEKEKGADMTGDYGAALCKRLEYNGYSDWFIPSVAEMEEIKKVAVDHPDLELGNRWYQTSNLSEEVKGSEETFWDHFRSRKTTYIRPVRVF